MGIGCSCFGISSSSSKKSPNLNNDHRAGFLTRTPPKAQIMDRNSTNLNRNNTIQMKRKFPAQIEDKSKNKKELRTLKDCLLDSPAVNGYYIISNADNQNQNNQNHFVRQNKVYPSLMEHDCPDYGYDNNYNQSRGSFSKDRLVKVGEVVEMVPSLRKNRSRKTEKRVSFKLPEEADIFIYNLTEDDDSF